jgi:hypothetical protein
MLAKRSGELETFGNRFVWTRVNVRMGVPLHGITNTVTRM